MSVLDATTGARLIVDAIVAGLRADGQDGVDVVDVVMAPGSRSTPLVAACARDPRVRLTVVRDERSGAFMALGMARAGGRAAVLLTTSGTAVANAAPAVVEADVDNVPLVVLTADRPLEATGTDANQTIEQRFFFGPGARAFVDVPPPEDVRDAAALEMAIDELVAAAHRAPCGPVHVNVRFRKPLEPTSTPAPQDGPPRLRRCGGGDTTLSAADRVALRDAVQAAESGVIVAGAAADDADSAGFRAVADALGWPVLACATSGLRHPHHALPAIATAATLRRAGRELPVADVVVRLGGAVVDDGLAQVCASAGQVVRIDERRRRRLERSAPTLLVDARPADVAACLVERGLRRGTSAPWEALARDDRRARAAIDDFDAAHARRACDEPAVARAVVDAALAGDRALFVGNSMPIRAVDRWCPRAPRVLANRGASGIDGLLSTAAGISRRRGQTLALVGDLSFLHDAGALSSLDAAPLRVVVLDNNGGGIFDFLPISRHEELLERCFTTPHAVDLVALCRACGVDAARLDDRAALRERLRCPIERPEVLVVPVARAGNVACYRERTAAVARALGLAAPAGLTP